MKTKHLMPLMLLAGVLALSLASTEDHGSAAEAKAMLEKTVAELKKDKAAALAKFNEGGGGFRDRDLYIFCADPDGTTTAHRYATEIGKNLNAIKDKNGKAFGQEMLKVAEPEKFKEVTYLWPKPGETEPVQKVSYVTKVGDQICGVGYYEPLRALKGGPGFAGE